MATEPELHLSARVCPKCGSKNIRLSALSTVADRLYRALFLTPFRCRACRKRFRMFSRATPPSANDNQSDNS